MPRETRRMRLDRAKRAGEVVDKALYPDRMGAAGLEDEVARVAYTADGCKQIILCAAGRCRAVLTMCGQDGAGEPTPEA